MRTKYFYDVFHLLYEEIKEPLNIHQKEELYRLLFHSLYQSVGDGLYDNDPIRKITTGNNTIHRRAAKKLCSIEGFELLRFSIEQNYLKHLSDYQELSLNLQSFLSHNPVIPKAVKNALMDSISTDSTYTFSRFLTGILICADHADYITKKEIRSFMEIDFMRLNADKALPRFPHYITDPPNAAVSKLIGREDELMKLHDLLLQKQGHVMLSAVGGLGKTEVAKAFLNRITKIEISETGIEEIGWIPYDNQDICLSLKHAMHLKCELSEVWDQVQEKASELRGRLLLVIDNIEHPAEDEYLQKLHALPCRILVTSRQRELFGFDNILYLQPLSMDNCRTLFYQHYQFSERDNEVLNDIINLTAKLTIMIVFLAKCAYLESMSLHELYGRLAESGFKLSEEDVSCEHEKMQDDSPIIKQMCILFSLLKYNDHDKHILTCISVIPNLAFDFPKAKRWFKITKNSSLMKLYQMGMLEHMTENRRHIYWMHSVIAAAVREQQKEKLYPLARPFVDILCEELIDGPVLGKEYEKAYLIPFSWSVADIMEQHWSVEDDTDFLTNLFHICFACSNYSLCEKLIEMIIAVQTDNPAFTKLDLAYSYREKIDLLQQFDRAEEATPIFHLIEDMLKDYDAPKQEKDILKVQYAIQYQIRGDYDMSRQYFQKILEESKASDSETKEKDIATAYTNLSRLLIDAGDYFEAYNCIKQAIDITTDDEKDADLIISYCNLAGVCTELIASGYGTTYVQEAYDAFKRVISFREKYLGKHHADTAVVYHDFAYFWYICSNYKEALKYNQMAYDIYEELFAEHSITRMRSLNTKALILWEIGEHQQVLDLYEHILEGTKILGHNYLVDYAGFALSYAQCLREVDQEERAGEIYQLCIDTWHSISENGYRNLSVASQQYADLLVCQGNIADALFHYQEAIKYNQNDWYAMIDTKDCYAFCLELNGKIEECISEYISILNMLLEYNVQDEETKFSLCNNLSFVLKADSQNKKVLREKLLAQIADQTELTEYTLHFFDNLT